MKKDDKEMRPQTKDIAKRSARVAAAALLIMAIAIAGCSDKKSQVSPTSSSSTAQTSFTSATEAGQALQAAAKAGDESALSRILGPNSKAILSSGDPVEDKAALESFASKYNQMNRWVTMTDGSQILNIGADNYPFPIPLVKDSSGKWYFNTKAGEDEILARQIGSNELLAIDACGSIGNAEELYVRQPHDGNPPHLYTTLIVSSPGKKDGLYWEVPQGQAPSPLGRVNNFAPSAISSNTSSGPTVIDGYAFRILTAQGDKAKGGAKNYLVNGKLTGGFAIIASPVKYHDSGIMTFIMSQEGTVYQKDLGSSTADAAAAIKDYNPSDGWTPAQ